MSFLLSPHGSVDPACADESSETLCSITMLCCGASIVTDWRNAPNLALMLDNVHECATVPLCVGR
jgi:hypothetical protein